MASALIFEDDADWDVRLKAQMQTFAQAARAFTQPVKGQTLGEQYRHMHHAEIPFEGLPKTISHPKSSPYGDDWDVLWLGHCGTELPAMTQSHGPSPLRVLIPNDATVPSPRHLQPHPFALQDPLGARYPPHTRVVHASRGTICLQAYAVSQKGARKLLRKFGLETFTAGWDIMLRDWCDGLYYARDAADNATGTDSDRHAKKRPPVCVVVEPPLFSHHYGKGTASDITTPGGGFVNKEKEMTPYLRLSVSSKTVFFSPFYRRRAPIQQLCSQR